MEGLDHSFRWRRIHNGTTDNLGHITVVICQVHLHITKVSIVAVRITKYFLIYIVCVYCMYLYTLYVYIYIFFFIHIILCVYWLYILITTHGNISMCKIQCVRCCCACTQQHCSQSVACTMSQSQQTACMIHSRYKGSS